MEITPAVLFKFYNAFAFTGWLFLWILPGRKITRLLVLNGVWPLMMAISYTVLIIGGISLSEGAPDFGSVQGVMKIFSSEWGVLTGWIHYLCFDLLIGSWIVTDARKRQISHWLILVPLFFTFMLGPVGFLMYWLIRFIRVKKTDHLF